MSVESNKFCGYFQSNDIEIKEKFFQKGICQFLYNIIEHSKDETLLKAVDKTITNFVETGTYVKDTKVGSTVQYYIDASEIPQEIYVELKAQNKIIMAEYKKQQIQEQKGKQLALKLEKQKKSDEVLNLLKAKKIETDFEEDEEFLPKIDD